MGKKKSVKAKAANSAISSQPAFPYTTAPNSLRNFLRAIPKKPKPVRMTSQVLESWGFGGTNERSIITVLKAVGLLGSSGEPNQEYEAFMSPITGPATLGTLLKNTYSQLFQTSHEPDKEPYEDLKRAFHIHSGGADRTISFQIQTFKTLCEFAAFDSASPASLTPPNALVPPTANGPHRLPIPQESGPTIHIDLHIHLPENKSSRDYEAIIEDIARYIYKLEDTPNG